MRVAVVGAGLAGLAAADALVRAGVDVVVLEARDRVGGRVWSRELPNGVVVEMGAEFVLPGNEAVRALVERFGLGWWHKGMRYGEREPRGVTADPLTVHAAAEAVAAALSGRPPHVGEPARAFLDGLDLHPGARAAIEARLEVSCADTADRIDASALRSLAAHSDEPCPSVARGNQRIAIALAAELGRAVRLEAPVERITWSEGRVRLAAAGAEVEADRAVVAVPASVIGRIVLEPPLPRPLADAYAAVAYGHAAKLFVPLRAPAPPSAVLSVPERYWTWTATGDDGVQPVVHAFAGSPPALAGLAVADGPAAWLGSLARLRPDLALDPAGAVLSTWDDDPWVAAAYSSSAPPPDAWRSVGPIHVCGEHTAGEAAALMEGALRSGARAAAEILSR